MDDQRPTPGLITVFSAGEPVYQLTTFDRGAIELGRDPTSTLPLSDPGVSRHHARVELSGEQLSLKDRGSRNGTAIDGAVTERYHGRRPSVIRVGATLLLPVADVRPFLRAMPGWTEGFVKGPRTIDVVEMVRMAARTSPTLLLRGESGSGKELMARVFHHAGPNARGPFVAASLSALPPTLAELLLFGERRGAVDRLGLVSAAAGGTLFLDEIGELPAVLRSRLLQALAKANVRLCAGTRSGRPDPHGPTVTLPPLRERPEEIPWLVALEGRSLAVDATFVEECLCRRWPGNVRELLTHTRAAVSRARAAGSQRLLASHLCERSARRAETTPTEPDIRRHLPQPPAGRRSAYERV